MEPFSLAIRLWRITAIGWASMKKCGKSGGTECWIAASWHRHMHGMSSGLSLSRIRRRTSIIISRSSANWSRCCPKPSKDEAGRSGWTEAPPGAESLRPDAAPRHRSRQYQYDSVNRFGGMDCDFVLADCISALSDTASTFRRWVQRAVSGWRRHLLMDAGNVRRFSRVHFRLVLLDQ